MLILLTLITKGSLYWNTGNNINFWGVCLLCCVICLQEKKLNLFLSNYWKIPILFLMCLKGVFIIKYKANSNGYWDQQNIFSVLSDFYIYLHALLFLIWIGLAGDPEAQKLLNFVVKCPTGLFLEFFRRSFLHLIHLETVLSWFGQLPYSSFIVVTMYILMSLMCFWLDEINYSFSTSLSLSI